MLIYKITNIVNNKIYVGLTTKTLEERIKQHKSDCNCVLKKGDTNQPLYNAVKKYKWSSFIFEVIELCNTIEELRGRERYWIERLKTTHFDVGYNINEGGEGGDNFKNHPRMDVVKKKISKGVRGSDRWTEERRLQQSKAFSGENNPMRKNPQNSWLVKNKPMSNLENRRYGKDNPMSNPEFRRRQIEGCKKKDYVAIGKLLSKANKGKIVSQETREKISKANRGVVRSEEFKQKVSRVHKGKITSKETREKMSIAHKGRVVSKETREKMSKAAKARYRKNRDDNEIK
jgi:group I intron endonuclease